MNKILIILNDAPYGSERSYNGLRLAIALLNEGIKVRLFLMADAVACAKKGQSTPQGYYNIEKMLYLLVRKGVAIKACGVCMDARGLKEDDLIEGLKKSNMKELSKWVEESSKVINF